jgi:hypothetical protein
MDLESCPTLCIPCEVRGGHDPQNFRHRLKESISKCCDIALTDCVLNVFVLYYLVL